ncbi:hypothetical protein SFR_4841 [Streptomyces sp. FR-008]|nr:hypothetical protein SFR_4841 [Streptomyces sp. FR-008]
MRVGAAQLVGGPAGQGVMDERVEPQQDLLALLPGPPRPFGRSVLRRPGHW